MKGRAPGHSPGSLTHPRDRRGWVAPDPDPEEELVATDPDAAEAALEAIRSAGIEREAALALEKAKTKAWKDAIRAAVDAGVSVNQVKVAADVNRARVYAILAKPDDD